ncbi:hypothetical protein IJF85_00725 [Candidatus Saccharibacteria bacterium]|nr:hypothetical protein [Candidatus Saccharibacteria bacterium]MBQ3263892.1 hypothetical protein [Candidatus Saccharibacteria bacterium]
MHCDPHIIITKLAAKSGLCFKNGWLVETRKIIQKIMLPVSEIILSGFGIVLGWFYRGGKNHARALKNHTHEKSGLVGLIIVGGWSTGKNRNPEYTTP